jgi:hypothetical protein
MSLVLREVMMNMKGPGIAFTCLLLSVASAAPQPADRDLAVEKRVTLACIRQPLSEVCQVLERQAAIPLEAAPDLREQKAIVLIRDRPLQEVMDRIAQVFGAEWVRKARAGSADSPPGYVLTRQRATRDWMAAWRQSRALADRSAREAQARFVRQFLGEVLGAVGNPGEDPPQLAGSLDQDLARFLKTLPSGALDRLAAHIGSVSPVREKGRPSEGSPPVVFTYRDLNPDQQTALRRWLEGRVREPGDYNVRLLSELPQARIALNSTDGVAIELQLTTPSNREPATFAAFGSSLSGQRLAEIAQDDLHRLMAGRRTPEGALLGAQLREDGSADPPVRFDTPALGGRPLPKPDYPPLRWQFLQWLNQECRLNIVADYYTRSQRARQLAPTLGESLLLASDAYGVVFRQQGDYLLCRQVTWPDDDLREIPAPLPEDWIAAKEAGNEFLRLEECAALASCTDEQVDALATYDDVIPQQSAPPRVVRFREEEQAARADPGRLRLLRLLAALPDDQKASARQDGVPFEVLPKALRQEALERAGTPIRRLVPRGRLRVVRTEPVAGRPTTVIGVSIPGEGTAREIPLLLLARVVATR